MSRNIIPKMEKLLEKAFSEKYDDYDVNRLIVDRHSYKELHYDKYIPYKFVMTPVDYDTYCNPPPAKFSDYDVAIDEEIKIHYYLAVELQHKILTKCIYLEDYSGP